MRKLLIPSIFSLLFGSIMAFASDKNTKSVPVVKLASKSATVAEQKRTDFMLKVTFGDKTTLFKVEPDKKGGLLKFSNNAGQEKTKSLSEKDMEYLKSEVSKVAESNDPKLCDSRKKIELLQPGKTTVGCIGSRTKTAKSLLNMANLFSGIVKM